MQALPYEHAHSFIAALAHCKPRNVSRRIYEVMFVCVVAGMSLMISVFWIG